MIKNENPKTNNDKKFVCAICGKVCSGYGNNPWPVVKDADAVCCDHCNWLYVIPARLGNTKIK